MMDTIRNLRLVDDVIRLGRRHHRDIARLGFSYTFRIPPMYGSGGACPPDHPRCAVHRPSVGRDPVTRQPVPEAQELRLSRRWINQATSALWTARVLLGSALLSDGCATLQVEAVTQFPARTSDEDLCISCCAGRAVSAQGLRHSPPGQRAMGTRRGRYGLPGPPFRM